MGSFYAPFLRLPIRLTAPGSPPSGSKMNSPRLDVTPVKFKPHAWICRLSNKDLDVSCRNRVECVDHRCEMVTVTDEILQESSSQFIRFYPMSYCCLYFKVMRFLKLLYLLIYYFSKELCHKIYRISVIYNYFQ